MVSLTEVSVTHFLRFQTPFFRLPSPHRLSSVLDLSSNYYSSVL